MGLFEKDIYICYWWKKSFTRKNRGKGHLHQSLVDLIEGLKLYPM